MKVIHYTPIENWSPRPITIKNGYKDNGLPDKPIGGIWTSPLNSKYGWKDYCKREDYKEGLEGCKQLLLDIDKEGMLKIDTKKDLDKLPRIYRYGTTWFDFETLVARGFKSMHLTENGFWNTRLEHPGLYSWDCEAVLIMDISVIKSWRYLSEPS